MLKDLNREELINEIYTRAYTKNYLLKESFNDELDYIACKIKKELGNFTTIQNKAWDKQCSSSKAFVRKVNKRRLYADFKRYINTLDNEIEGGSYLEDIFKHDKPELDRTYLRKDKFESQVKWFIRIIHDKNMVDVMSDDINGYDFKFYGDIYRECEKVADENIKQQEELIKSILNKAFDEVDLSFNNKQIVKFVNTRIGWLFGNKRRELPGWKRHTIEESKNNAARSQLKNKRMHVLQYWFGLNGMFDTEIQELKFLTNSQRDFILNCLNIAKELSYKRNKKGHWDLSKKELGDKLGLSLYAIDKRMVRIRDKVKANGIEVVDYYNTYEKNAKANTFKAQSKEQMIEDMYVSEEDRMMMQEMWEYEEENKDEVDRYFEDMGLSSYNYNFW